MPLKDPDKKREYDREWKRKARLDPQWRDRERERIVAANRTRRQEAMKDPDLAEDLRKRAREQMRKWREENPQRSSRPKKDYAKLWREAHLELARAREAARGRVAYAIRTGRLVPQPCEDCGAPAYRNNRRYVHAHHEDYEKPLEVNWLCPRCHAALRRIS